MREIYVDFMRLYDQPDGSIRLPLGFADQALDLDGLTDNERVRFVDPGSLTAEGTVVSEEVNGRLYWYGVLRGHQAIHVWTEDDEHMSDTAPASATK